MVSFSERGLKKEQHVHRNKNFSTIPVVTRLYIFLAVPSMVLMSYTGQHCPHDFQWYCLILYVELGHPQALRVH